MDYYKDSVGSQYYNEEVAKKGAEDLKNKGYKNLTHRDYMHYWGIGDDVLDNLSPQQIENLKYYGKSDGFKGNWDDPVNTDDYEGAVQTAITLGLLDKPLPKSFSLGSIISHGLSHDFSDDIFDYAPHGYKWKDADKLSDEQLEELFKYHPDILAGEEPWRRSADDYEGYEPETEEEIQERINQWPVKGRYDKFLNLENDWAKKEEERRKPFVEAMDKEVKRENYPTFIDYVHAQRKYFKEHPEVKYQSPPKGYYAGQFSLGSIISHGIAHDFSTVYFNKDLMDNPNYSSFRKSVESNYRKQLGLGDSGMLIIPWLDQTEYETFKANSMEKSRGTDKYQTDYLLRRFPKKVATFYSNTKEIPSEEEVSKYFGKKVKQVNGPYKRENLPESYKVYHRLGGGFSEMEEESHEGPNVKYKICHDKNGEPFKVEFSEIVNNIMSLI